MGRGFGPRLPCWPPTGGVGGKGPPAGGKPGLPWKPGAPGTETFGPNGGGVTAPGIGGACGAAGATGGAGVAPSPEATAAAALMEAQALPMAAPALASSNSWKPAMISAAVLPRTTTIGPRPSKLIVNRWLCGLLGISGYVVVSSSQPSASVSGLTASVVTSVIWSLFLVLESDAARVVAAGLATGAAVALREVGHCSPWAAQEWAAPSTSLLNSAPQKRQYQGP